MFSTEYGEAAVEVLDILDNTNKSDLEKIPTDFIKFLVDIASKDYIVNLDHSKQISEMNLKEKTKEILGYIYINWWCDQQEKEIYNKKIKEIEIKRQEILREKYNPDKIFENQSKIAENTSKIKEIMEKPEIVAMIEYKESMLKKIWTRILKIFNK